MFGGNKISGAKASAGVAGLPTQAKPPAISGGAAMMLKSMGIDPAAMEGLAEAFLNDVSTMAARVDAIEARMGALEDQNNRIEAMLKEVLAKVASNG